MDPATPPVTIGPYEVLARLGEGGMGVVYRARHRTTGALAAVKTVLVENEGAAQGIRREIRALARLRHPGIAKILDEGIDHGRPYYAMELTEGRPLTDWLPPPSEAATATAPRPSQADGAPPGPSSGPRPGASAASSPALLSPAEAHRIVTVLGIMRRLATTLAFLHGEGVVHRDLKPSNVIVDARGEPVLIDFGLATQFEGRLSLGLQAATGAIMATPLYMAPELLAGRVVDARADLYSLGCMLYQLLAGRPPFDGALAVIAHGHAHLQPTPLEALVPALPVELCRLVARLLAKRPSERLGYADDVAAVLSLCLADARPRPEPATRPRAYVYQPEICGRDAELQRLVAALPTPTAHPRARALLVLGEAGIGKTRLLLELARTAAERRVIVLMGECQRDAGQGLRRPLQEIVDACRVGGAEERRRADRVFGARGHVLAPHLPEVLELAGQAEQPRPPELPPREAQERLVSAIIDTIDAFADLSGALLVLLDDVQWADGLTLACALRLAAAPSPLTLVMAQRSDEGARFDRAQVAIDEVTLQRLGPADIDAMVGDMLALPSAAARALGAHVFRHSEGNPFFVAEYVRLAVGEGRLQRDPTGLWRMPAVGVGLGLELPTSLRDILTLRLSGLGKEGEALLTALAVFGMESPLALAQSASGLGEEALQIGMRELVQRHIVTEPRPGVVRFGHIKLAELAYERLPPARLPELHGTAAKAIEARAAATGEGRGQVAAALARHYQHAHETLEALSCLLLAAQHASSGRDAIALLDSAIALAESVPETPESLRLAIDARVEIYGRRLQVYSAADPDNMRICQGAVQLAQRLGDPVRLARVEANLAGSWFTRGNYELLIHHGQRSMAYAEESGSLGNLASAAFVVAMGYYETGRTDALFELAPRVLTLIDEGHQRTDTFGAPYPPAVTLCTVLGLGYAYRGDRAASEASMNDGLSVARAARHRYVEGLSHVVASWGSALFGAGPSPAEHGAAARLIAREIASPGLEMLSAGAIGLGRLATGRPYEAIASFEEGLTLAARIGYPSFTTTTLWGLAQAHLELGDLDAVRAAADKGLAFSRQTGECKLDPEFLRFRGDADLRSAGETSLPAAEAAARASLALAEHLKARVLMPAALLLLGRATSRRGARVEAQDALGRARDEAVAMGLAGVAGAAALALAGLQAGAQLDSP